MPIFRTLHGGPDGVVCRPKMTSPVEASLSQARSGMFPATRWSCVSMLRRDPTSPEGQRALGDLCAAYWYPIYSFARRKGQSVADAQDLTQSFFARILGGGLFANARETEGKMRSFLLTAFTRHMADEWDRAQAQKRGGDVEVLSLDFEIGEQRFLHESIPDKQSVDESFDRAWARSVLDQAGNALERECAASGKADLFAAVSPLITGSGDVESYEQLTKSTGMSPEALRQAVRRMRLRFRDLLRQAVADTLHEPDAKAIDEELVALRAALSR